MQAQSLRDPADAPCWSVVSPADLGRRPYHAIGSIVAVRRGYEIGHGTAWLAGSNAAVTVAHVIDEWASIDVAIRVVFPGTGEVARVVDAVVPPAYGQSKGPFDPWNLAIMRLEPGARPFLTPGPRVLSAVRVLGFPYADARLVESRATTLQTDGAFLLHHADTVTGQRGGPILNAGDHAVVGLHLAGVGSGRDSHAGLRVGLALRPELERFIAETVAPWR